MTRPRAVQLPNLLSQWRPVFICAFQAILVFGSLVLAWLLRFDFTLPYRRVLLTSALILVAVRLVTLLYFRLHRGWWHFAGVGDVVNILKAVSSGSLVFFLLNRYLFRVAAFPRSIYFLEPILTASLLAGTRLTSRVLAESVRRDSSSSKRVMLVGAGFAAQMVIRELSRPGSGYVVAGCIDDDVSKLGIHVLGIPVRGCIFDLERLVSENPPDEILIAIPSATGKQMQRIAEECQKTRLPFRTVPTLRDILRGDASINQFREVRLEDLLGRNPVEIDLESVRRQLQGAVILVTGAAGSIGSELCQQILEYDPAKLVCIDQNETGIFYLQPELRKRAGRAKLVCLVADVGDSESMRRCFSDHEVDFVFHAAAYKHVPVMEANVAEALRNNVFALNRLLDIAEEEGCRGFLLISSDKAVNPTSVMGASKRIGELILASRPQNGMRCVSVRFGNVLGSSGSIVPILKEKLRQGKPLTITHPDVRRFFMTTHEAVSLVLHSFTLGSHGDILVLEMGSPVSIHELARTLIRLSGKSAESVQIQFTGLRDGEKLEEELFYESEMVSATTSEKIKRTTSSRYVWLELQQALEELRTTLTLDGAATIRAKIKEIVPEYSFREDPQARTGSNAPVDALLQRAANHD